MIKIRQPIESLWFTPRAVPHQSFFGGHSPFESRLQFGNADTGVEASLRRALREYLVHYHTERNHQGKGNVLLFPTVKDLQCRSDVSVRCRERLGGLLKYYHREAA